MILDTAAKPLMFITIDAAFPPSMRWCVPSGQHGVVVPEGDIAVRQFDRIGVIGRVSDTPTNRHGKYKLDGCFRRIRQASES